MNDDTEQELVTQAQNREPAAIAELFRRYWRAARAAAYGVTGNMDLAEDAASEAFVAALDSLGDLKDTTRFGPWLRTIVLRTAKHLRASGAEDKTGHLHEASHDESQSPEQDLQQRELAALIHEAVAGLSDTLREAMSLFYFEGYSLKDAAGFLDVPEGTLKRRLHEGRQALRKAAEQISKGSRPENHKRELVLGQLRELMDKEPDQETLYQAMRQALGVRPVPMDLLRKAAMKTMATHKKNAGPMTPEREQSAREMLARVYQHSKRARNPNHPVGRAAAAIRAALPEFQHWERDFSKLDVSNMAVQMVEGKAEFFATMLPADFYEEATAAYIGATRAWLVHDEDGHVCTSYELMQRKATSDAFKQQAGQTSNISDALWLLWKTTEPLELRDVEQMIRTLAETVAPNATLCFSTYNEPRYRAALRMQFEGNPVPAAIGGVLNPWPGLSDKITVAGTIIYLEPWAVAQTGQPVELEDFSLEEFVKKPPQ